MYVCRVPVQGFDRPSSAVQCRDEVFCYRGRFVRTRAQWSAECEWEQYVSFIMAVLMYVCMYVCSPLPSTGSRRRSSCFVWACPWLSWRPAWHYGPARCPWHSSSRYSFSRSPYIHIYMYTYNCNQPIKIFNPNRTSTLHIKVYMHTYMAIHKSIF